MKFEKYLSYICNEFSFKKSETNFHEFQHNKNGNKIILNINKNKWNFAEIKVGNESIWDLQKEENWIKLILCCKLIKIGYSKKRIVLEKKLDSGFVDFCLEKNEKPYYMIEVKTPKEIGKYISNSTKEKQLFKYLFQEKLVKVASYYTFYLDNERDSFHNVISDENLRNSNNSDDLFSNKWNKLFDNTNLLSLKVFDFKTAEKKFSDLKEIKETDSDRIFNELLRILRVHSVSDKSNAFDKIINLFIAKVRDEECEDEEFSVETNDLKMKFCCLRFQFLERIDTLETFMKRLSNLYKEGMKIFLEKEVIDCPEEEVREILNSLEANLNPADRNKISKIIDDLRLKKSNFFAFIEVFDNDTFEKNSYIVKEVAKILSEYKFRYNYESEFLGYLFEKLLNESLKQEFGQFFTPLPLVDFMVSSLPLKEKLEENIKGNKKEIIPLFIDYACGSGHFLNSYIHKLQEQINNLNQNEYPSGIKSKLNTYKDESFSWVENNVFGIEKDYRLAKTTKISLFLNGDGLASILHADALNKFSCDDYAKVGSKLFSSKDNKNETFDFVVSNPPYAVKGYMQNFSTNDIRVGDGTFELFEKFSDKDSTIEIIFIERAWQLLKQGGFAFIILPNLFLSVDKYSNARKWVLERFQILTIFCSGDSTFAYTPTSTSIFFMRKKSGSPKMELDYQCLLINSPKTFANSRKVGIKEERKFLGYQFSNARGKLRCKEINKNLVDNYSPLIKEMCSDSLKSDELSDLKEREKWVKNKERRRETKVISSEHSQLIILRDIVLHAGDKNRYCFYTKYKKPQEKEKFFTLKELEELGICQINIQRTKTYDKENLDFLKHVEITNLKSNKVVGSFKDKRGSRIAKKDDILFPCLVYPNWWERITKAEEDYKVSSAIYTITISDEEKQKYVLNYLKDNKNKIFEDIKTLLGSFKITYSRISVFNLMNNIYFAKPKEE